MNRTAPSLAIDRFMNWSLDRPLPPRTRYLAATLLVSLAALVRILFITNLLPWLIFMPVALAVGLAMGRRTGFYAVLLSAFIAGVTIAPPGAPYWLTGPQWIASALYIVIAGSVVVIAAELRAAFKRARLHAAERERFVALLVEKEERSRLLNNELGHRLKNLLTIVQAVAGQTLRQAPDLAAANTALAARLAAFGRAADVLTASSWETVELATLLRAAIDGHVGLDDRVRLDGPPLRFRAQVALALALAFHELATNAVKYGALSNDTGRVEVRWRIASGTDGGGARFHLLWCEVGGPPVNEPARRGFGSLMIERSLRSYLKGEAAIAFDPDGLQFRIDAPLDEAQALVT